MAGRSSVPSKSSALIAMIADEDTITGFLLAGVGNVDIRRKTNYLIVDSRQIWEEIYDASPVLQRFLEKNPYFQQQTRVTGKKGLSFYVNAIFRIMSYGVAADDVNEYLRIGESIAYECLKRFTRVVFQYVSAIYLREIFL